MWNPEYLWRICLSYNRLTHRESKFLHRIRTHWHFVISQNDISLPSDVMLKAVAAGVSEQDVTTGLSSKPV